MGSIRFVGLGSVDQRSECYDHERQLVAIELNSRRSQLARSTNAHSAEINSISSTFFALVSSRASVQIR